ncbi:MAG: hypothetical protein ACYDAO_04465 [Thermoplasmataceae archaeon]
MFEKHVKLQILLLGILIGINLQALVTNSYSIWSLVLAYIFVVLSALLFIDEIRKGKKYRDSSFADFMNSVENGDTPNLQENDIKKVNLFLIDDFVKCLNKNLNLNVTDEDINKILKDIKEAAGKGNV